MGIAFQFFPTGGIAMKKISNILLFGLTLLTLLVMMAGCGNREGQTKQNLQIAIEAANKQKTPENYLTLSLRYYEAGQFEKCIEAAQEAIKLRPHYAPAYNNIGAAYNSLKMWEKGIEACQKALEIDPGFQLAKNNLNWALSQKQLGGKK